MPHFLITAIGSYGDVHPMVGLGATLRARGHDVQLITNPYFEEVVAAAGLPLIPLSDREEYLRMTQHPDLWHPRRGAKLVLEYGMVIPMRPLYKILSEHATDKTVLVAHGLDLASRVLGEQKNLPVASVDFAPQAFWSIYQSPRLVGGLTGDGVPRWLKRLQMYLAEKLVADRLVGRPLNVLRREVGLPEVQRFITTWWHETPLVVGMFPEWFAPPQPDWPPQTVLAGFPLWDAPERSDSNSTIKDELDDFLAGGDRPIVFSPGSANREAQDFFRVAVEICGRLGCRGLLMTKYAEQVPPNLPPSVRHFGFLPLSRVLPHAAAFVHHGGIGSCAQGLAAGVPHLVRPMAFDQFDNVARLKKLGVADEVSIRRFDGTLVAEKLRRQMDSSQVAARCDELARRCDGPKALARACEALESIGLSSHSNPLE